MAGSIPSGFRDLFDKKVFAHLATEMPDGSPQVSPVWVSYDGEHVLVNSAKGRLKDRNVRARPSVALSIQDPDNPYRYLGIRGRVVEVTEEGAEDLIHQLAKKYMGVDQYPYLGDDVRVIYKIKPLHAHTMD